jgi:hypothetical protein
MTVYTPWLAVLGIILIILKVAGYIPVGWLIVLLPFILLAAFEIVARIPRTPQ